MISVLVFIGGLLGLGVAVLGLISMRSDIQLILAAVGFFSALSNYPPPCQRGKCLNP